MIAGNNVTVSSNPESSLSAAVEQLPEALQSLLGCLLGKDVIIRKPAAASPRIAKGHVTAVYRTDDGYPAATCTCDVSLAAYAGAALTLIPASVAAEAIADRSLPDNLLDNTKEILNVCAQLLNGISEEHHTLAEVIEHDGSPVNPVDAAIRGGTPILDLEVAIKGYGGGRLTLRKR